MPEVRYLGEREYRISNFHQEFVVKLSMGGCSSPRQRIKMTMNLMA